jgi:serine/threonine-protein kinase RsbW
MRGILAGEGYAAIPAPSLDEGTRMLANGMVCRLALISSDVMDRPDAREKFDVFAAAGRPPPRIIVYGLVQNSQLALHCLNRGALDFLSRPLDPAELRWAAREAIVRAPSPASSSSAIVADQPAQGWVELTSSSEMKQFHRLQRFSAALFASRLDPADCEDLKLAVEEVGRNAVEWGNRFSPDKSVRVSYCLFTDRVVIKIEDEGEGFIPDAVPNPSDHPTRVMRDRRAAGKRPGGYGVFLTRKLVDRIEYNEKGNVVLMTKYLAPTGAAETEKS